MVTTTFHFVDHAAAPGRESRRAIRSHVMKGKNVGKVRIPKRPAHQAPRAVVKPYYNLPPPAPTTTKLSPEKDDRHSTTSSSPEAKTPDTSSSITTITTTTTTSSNTSRAVARAPRTHRTLRLNPRSPAQVANELSGLASPGDLTPQTRDFVIHFLRHVGRALYPIQFCSTGPDPEFLVWFRYMLFDEAYFHTFVALSEVTYDVITGRRRARSKEFRQHVSTALCQINQRLSGPGALDDSSLAGVVMMCLLSSGTAQPATTRIHLAGLCRMIELRGGIDALRASNLLLAEKAFRIDVDLALQLGCDTRLRPSQTIEDIVPLLGDATLAVPSPLLNAVRNTASPAVLDAAHDVLKVSRLLSLPGLAARKLRPAHFQVLVTTLCYRLIAICPVAAAASPRGLDHPVAAAVHLALLSYMTTFFITLGRYRLTPYDLLAARLRDALDDPGFKRSVDPATHLWILVVGGISVLDGDADWLRPRVVAAADAFGTTDWRFARRLLSKYPWIGDLHDQPGSGFWTKCFSETLSKH